MRLSLIAVGRLRKGPEKALVDLYLTRLPWSVTIREIVEDRTRDSKDRIRRESDALLAAVPDGAKLIALDQQGRTLSSEDLAAQLGAWRDGGERDIAFLIGGAAGFDQRVRARADLVLSLGRMTWPHLLVRVLLAEQLYRAHSIQTGHPYHRGESG